MLINNVTLVTLKVYNTGPFFSSPLILESDSRPMNIREHIRNALTIFELRRLNNSLAITERGFARDIKAANAAKDYKKVRDLKDSMRWETGLINEEINHHHTRKLLQHARTLMVPIPDWPASGLDDNEFWSKGHQTGNWYLTLNGYSLLRTSIRNEIKQRHEIRTQWIVWVSVVTGLVGACTGFLAVYNGNG